MFAVRSAILVLALGFLTFALCGFRFIRRGFSGRDGRVAACLVDSSIASTGFCLASRPVDISRDWTAGKAA